MGKISSNYRNFQTEIAFLNFLHLENHSTPHINFNNIKYIRMMSVKHEKFEKLDFYQCQYF